MRTATKGYKTKLKQYKELQSWYDNMCQGSENTADVNLRRLISFCEEISITPSQLTKMSQKDLYDLLISYVAKKHKQISPRSGRPYAGSYIHSTIKAAKSWLSFNDITIKKVKVRGAEDRPTLENEVVPTQEQLKLIFQAATVRDRVSCVLVSHAGLRPETLGNYHGDDGLRIKDFPELVVEGDRIIFTTMPTKVIVRPELSKTRQQYFTFLSEEGCEYLKAYLEFRMRQGEQLTSESDIIHPKLMSKRFITTINIGDGIKETFRKAGFISRPYVLRSYCDTQLMIAESKGKIPNQYRKFFMGHKGDMDARYTTNKKQLPPDVIEDMREAYRRAQPFLQTSNPGLSEEQVNLNLRKQMLTLMGFTQEQIEQIAVEEKSDEEIQALIREKMTALMVNNGNSQKVVLDNEIEEHISKGWTYVDKIPGGKVIMKLPH